jgi:hypothetical protein
MKLPNWLKRKKEKTIVEQHREFLVDQLRQAKVFYACFDLAYKNGLQCEMIFKIDGQVIPSSIMTDRVRNKQLFEFMANFAAAERMVVQGQIDDLDRLGSRGSWARFVNDNPGMPGI